MKNPPDGVLEDYITATKQDISRLTGHGTIAQLPFRSQKGHRNSFFNKCLLLAR